MQTLAITSYLLNGFEHTVAQSPVTAGEHGLEGSSLWAAVGLNMSSIGIWMAHRLDLLGCYWAAGPPGCVTQRPSNYKRRRDQIVWKESTSVITAMLDYK